jgi:hypothetical protein
LCGCAGTKPETFKADLPDYNGPDEVPHGPPPLIKPENIVIPDTPKVQVAGNISNVKVYPRSTWTKTGPVMAESKPMGAVMHVTFHHSGDGKAFTAVDPIAIAKHIEGVRQYHRQRGMIDIGYHFAIDGAGRVWELRPYDLEGQHVRNSTTGKRWNANNLGIVVLGDFEKQNPTPAAKTCIETFAKQSLKFFKLKPDAIHVHGELVQTDCPGGALGPWIKAMRKTL